MTKKQYNTLAKIYNECVEGKLKKYNFTLCDFEVFCDAANRLKNNEKAEFIQKNLAELFEKCGFTVKEHGIGWIVE